MWERFMMRNKLRELFQEVEWIEDEDLREKVLFCWEEAIKRSSFGVDELATLPFTLMIEEAPFSLLTHTRAVTRTARNIALAMEEIYPGKVSINMDYLIAGALLHDVAKVLEYEKSKGKVAKSGLGRKMRHPVSGAALAYSLGLPEDVVHIIAAHSREGELVKRTIEATIVHHADFVNFEAFRG